jgi:hypothetical protein
MAEIRASLIYEMLGRPPEFLKENLEKYLVEIEKEKDVKIISKKINDPKPVKDSKEDLFITFAETEMSFKDPETLLRTVFLTMPSNVEITSPSEIKINNFDMNTMLNELSRRLHEYDSVTRRLAIQIDFLNKKLKGEKVEEKEKKTKNE